MPKHAKEVDDRLRAELAEQTELADLGELAGQINHKFNNFLNSLLLRLALLETELPEAAADNFADIRRQANHIAELIRQVQQSRRGPLVHAPTHDWHRLLKRVVDRLADQLLGQSSAIQLELSPRNARVAGSAMDYERLGAFLLRDRLTEPGAASRTLTVRTTVSDDKAVLSIEDPCTKLTATRIANLFEPDTKEVEGMGHLVRAACKAIARRLQGRISAAPLEAGGLVIEVEFPLVSRT